MSGNQGFGDIGSCIPEQFCGNTGAAGNVITLTPTSGDDIVFALVVNPGAGADANDIGDVLHVSIDGTDPNTKRTTVKRNGTGEYSGMFNELKLTSETASTNYQVILYYQG